MIVSEVALKNGISAPNTYNVIVGKTNGLLIVDYSSNCLITAGYTC